MRFVGGLLYIAGSILMVVNLIATVRQGSFEKDVPVEAPALAKISDARKEGEGKHLWLERMPLYLSIISFRSISNWRYDRNYPYINCKR